MSTHRGFRDLKVYQRSYALAMEIFLITRTFPAEEKYSLTDQIRRSSRSVAANIAEGYRKRLYLNAFIAKMSDADGEAAETQVWLDMAKDCGYISPEKHRELIEKYEEVGRMIGGIMARPERLQ